MTDFIQGHDVPENIYRAAKDWAASDLKYGITNGLEALYQKKFGKDNPPKTTTPAMRIGSMVHCFCLEPKLFPERYALLDDKRSKEGKKLASQLAQSGRETFTTSEMDTFMGIYNALSKNEFAKKYVIDDTSGKAEQSYWWTHSETGLPCKARCDYVVGDMVIDLKTTGESGANPDKFTRTVVAFNYHLQAAHYLQATGAERFIFIVVEKVHPYSVGVYELSPNFIKKGYELQKEMLQKILEATKTKFWQGYTNACPEGIQTLASPKWL